MTEAYFEILRAGVNSTYQDFGRDLLYHIGIPFSGSMDKRNFLISNKLVENKKKFPVIEFALQGPLLKLKNSKVNFVITGDVNFNIIRRNSKVEKGNCYETYNLEDGEQLDIISTNRSVYGYLSVQGGYNINPFWKSYSVNTKAKIGPNNGEKFSIGQKIYLNNVQENLKKKKINYLNSKIEFIRVIKGTNYEYFSDEAKKIFLSKEFTVSKLSDRMGMRLEGMKLENIVNTNIKSEGLIKGVIQVPADGKPIVMLSDHGTIGGYPKLAVVISADYDKIVQLPPGAKVKFKLIDLKEAENLYKLYNLETENILNQI
tara:strand:- start:107 stop:1054 length:948 start_codon:yes stop_codon:yes gene_type:complete